jgi:hypothetical protein
MKPGPAMSSVRAQTRGRGGPAAPPAARDADEQRIERAFHVIFGVAAAVLALVCLLLLGPGPGAPAPDSPGEAQYGWPI